MIRKYTILILLLSLIIGCDDRLDVIPQDTIVGETAFSDGELILGILTGVYGSAQSAAVLNGRPQLIAEWQADNVEYTGIQPDFVTISRYTTLSNNSEVYEIWTDHYRTIGLANLVIAKALTLDDPEFGISERIKAVSEAKFMRALCYFQMATFWAQPLGTDGGTNLAVPLVLEPFEGTILFPERASLNSIYQNIESDLLEASMELDNIDRTRATKGAAQALLARLYLYQERWTEAATMATEVISSGFFALNSDFGFYDEVNSEFIFVLINTPQDNAFSAVSYPTFTNPVPAGFGTAPFSHSLVEAYLEEPDDLRYQLLTQSGMDAAGDERVFTTKFNDSQTLSDNVPVIRITEMYLTRAEANLRANNTIGDSPMNDINKLRARAALSPLGSLSLDQILTERRKELAMEGHRRMDLLRNGMALRRPGMPNEVESAPGQNRVIFPIPLVELDLNENLMQNPGY